MGLAARGDLVVVARDHDRGDGPRANGVEGLDERFDGDGAARVPEIAKEDNAGVAREGGVVDATENLHGDGGGLTVDVEVAEDDPATRGGVRGTEGVVREDVQRRLRGRCGARPRTSARGRCCFRAAALGRGVRGRVGDGDGADDRGAAAVGARARGFEPGDDGVGPPARGRGRHPRAKPADRGREDAAGRARGRRRRRHRTCRSSRSPRAQEHARSNLRATRLPLQKGG